MLVVTVVYITLLVALISFKTSSFLASETTGVVNVTITLAGDLQIPVAVG